MALRAGFNDLTVCGTLVYQTLQPISLNTFVSKLHPFVTLEYQSPFLVNHHWQLRNFKVCCVVGAYFFSSSSIELWHLRTLHQYSSFASCSKQLFLLRFHVYYIRSHWVSSQVTAVTSTKVDSLIWKASYVVECIGREIYCFAFRNFIWQITLLVFS